VPSELVAGVRVVVRRRLPEGGLTDVVGTLLAADADRLLVGTRAGEVSVPVADVVVAKAVPPRPVRAAAPHLALDVAGLEDVAADGWRAVESAWLDGPGSWLLRASEGFTGRGNSALPLAPPADGLDDALERVTRWYADRGLPATVVLAEPLESRDDESPVPGLRAALEAAGWQPRNPSLVMVGAARDVPAHDPPLGLTIDLAEEPDEGWLSLYRYRGQRLPPVARRLLVSAPRQVFAAVRDGADTVAVGRLAASRGWAGLTAMEVADSHRRRGLGRAVLSTLARSAPGLGARSLYLQVAEPNAAARGLYAAAGFTAHHRYGYWSPAA